MTKRPVLVGLGAHTSTKSNRTHVMDSKQKVFSWLQLGTRGMFSEVLLVCSWGSGKRARLQVAPLGNSSFAEICLHPWEICKNAPGVGWKIFGASHRGQPSYPSYPAIPLSRYPSPGGATIPGVCYPNYPGCPGLCCHIESPHPQWDSQDR